MTEGTNDMGMQPPAPERRRGARYVLMQAIKLLFILLAVGLASYQLVIHWQAVAEFQWRFDPLWLILSIAMHLITFWLFSAVWCQLIGGFGYSVPVKYGFKIGYITNLSRYLPGRIWPVFGMAYFAKRLGIREQDSITSWVVALLFAISASFIAAGVGLMLRPELMSAELQKNLGVSVLIVAVIMFLATVALTVLPGPALAVLNFVLKILRRKPVSFHVSVGVSAKVFFGYAVCWIAYGLSFWMFLKSIAGSTELPIIPLATAFIIAYQLGYLAIFTPGGVGVRELVLIGLLSPYLGPVVAGIAVAARLWNLIVEIAAFLIAWRIKLPESPDRTGGGDATDAAGDESAGPA